MGLDRFQTRGTKSACARLLAGIAGRPQGQGEQILDMARDESARVGARQGFCIVQDMQIAGQKAHAVIVGRERTADTVIHIAHKLRDSILPGADDGELQAIGPAIGTHLRTGHQIGAANADLGFAAALRRGKRATGIHEEKKIVIVLRDDRARTPVDGAIEHAPAVPQFRQGAKAAGDVKGSIGDRIRFNAQKPAVHDLVPCGKAVRLGNCRSAKEPRPEMIRLLSIDPCDSHQAGGDVIVAQDRRPGARILRKRVRFLGGRWDLPPTLDKVFMNGSQFLTKDISRPALMAAAATTVIALAPVGGAFAHMQKTQPQPIPRGTALMQPLQSILRDTRARWSRRLETELQEQKPPSNRNLLWHPRRNIRPSMHGRRDGAGSGHVRCLRRFISGATGFYIDGDNNYHSYFRAPTAHSRGSTSTGRTARQSRIGQTTKARSSGTTSIATQANTKASCAKRTAKSRPSMAWKEARTTRFRSASM